MLKKETEETLGFVVITLMIFNIGSISIESAGLLEVGT